jgi:signal transduction histidine kinase
MLYLRLLKDEPAGTDAQRVVLCIATARLLENALLATDARARRDALQCAAANDAAFSKWAACTVGLYESPARTLTTALSVDGHPNGHEADERQFEQRFVAFVARLADCERREADFDQRLQQEKLASLKEMAYGASHEINNPLANIAARAQTLLQNEGDSDRRRKLSAIHRQAMRAHEMIADLMLFARPPKLIFAPCDVCEIARCVTGNFTALAAERSTHLSCQTAEEPILASGDATQLSVAIGALVTNALEAVGANGNVQVAVAESLRRKHPRVEITVRDDGPGIPPEIERHMFDPFFSGREAGRGLGFGLSKCWRIVTDHGGQVVVRHPPRGAEIAVLLPSMQNNQ